MSDCHCPKKVQRVMLCSHGAAMPLILAKSLDDPVVHAVPGLLIGPQNSLLCYDARTGLQKWSRGFDAPPVAAYPAGASQNVLSGKRKDFFVV